MKNQHNEIVSLYETHGMGEVEIAEELGVSVNAVKAVLLQYSKVHKRAHKKLENEYISEDMLRRLYEDHFILATESDNDAVRLKAAQYLINDRRGRLDVEVKAKEEKPANNTNIFNILIQRAAEQKAKVLDASKVEVKELKAA